MSSSGSDRDATECVGGDKLPTRAISVPAGRNVGIISIASYFPKTYVSQKDLEKFDGGEKFAGKYTIGLMQENMGFCTDLEDINSIALTVTKQLIDKAGIDPKDVGYLEVGTETILDKSKSVKTVLMELFESNGNTDIEGVDTTNACYGGTAALFHAIDHCYSPNWDGRLAIVVSADIAIYDKGPARPTGGCGAVAMLIGPNAPLVFDPFRATHMTHTYDFYKPDPSSEYPTVDGKSSLQAYITAVDKCYQAYRAKYINFHQRKESSEVSLMDQFDAILMHSPYCKLVRKAFARFLYNEFGVIDEKLKQTDRYKGYQQIPVEELTMSYENWLKPINNTSLEKVSISLTEQSFKDKTDDSLFLSKQVGNMYTASLYSCLVAYLTSKPIEKLVNQPILFFSYGSGSAASMFSAQLTSDNEAIKKLLHGIEDARFKLNDRLKVTPEEFTAHLEHRAKTFSKPNRAPTGQPIEASNSGSVGQVTVESYLYPGTYYLTSVDEMFRRKYSRYDSNINENNNNDDICVHSKKASQINIKQQQQQQQQVTNI